MCDKYRTVLAFTYAKTRNAKNNGRIRPGGKYTNHADDAEKGFLVGGDKSLGTAGLPGGNGSAL